MLAVITRIYRTVYCYPWVEVYSEGALGSVRKWCRFFKEGGTNVHDKKRSGRADISSGKFFSIRLRVDSLRAGRSGDRIPVGGEIFRSPPDRPWGPHSLLYNGYPVSFPGEKLPGRGASHPIPSSCRGSRKGRAIPLLPLLGPQGLL
jgi:hypothetical protein